MRKQHHHGGFLQNSQRIDNEPIILKDFWILPEKAGQTHKKPNMHLCDDQVRRIELFGKPTKFVNRVVLKGLEMLYRRDRVKFDSVDD